MKTKINFLIFLSGGIIFAQDNVYSNHGDLYVSPGTQVSTHHAFNNHDTGNVLNDGEIYFYSDYHNQGLFTYTTNSQTGHVVFAGQDGAVQNITGDQPSRFYDVLFDKTGAGHSFHVSKELQVAGKSDFSNGVVLVDKLQGGEFIFLKDAEAVNASDDSHVEGQVIKEGDNAFIYPIGKEGYYRFAHITAPEEEEHSYLGEYFMLNSDPDHPHSHRTGVIEAINDREYWSIHRGQGTEGSVILTLSWHDNTTPSEMYQDEGKGLRIVRWDAGQKLWVDEGGIVDHYARTVTSPVKVDGFGIFTLGKAKTDLLNDGDVVVYNGVSPDGDGMNDYFIIDNIQRFPNNTVTIYNRWGREVYQTTNYDSNNNVFKGYAEGVKTFISGEPLPTGTYFYVLEYLYENNGEESRWIKKSGYLHLENN